MVRSHGSWDFMTKLLASYPLQSKRQKEMLRYIKASIHKPSTPQRGGGQGLLKAKKLKCTVHLKSGTAVLGNIYYPVMLLNINLVARYQEFIEVKDWSGKILWEV